jgi:hypothetical protein
MGQYGREAQYVGEVHGMSGEIHVLEGAYVCIYWEHFVQDPQLETQRGDGNWLSGCAAAPVCNPGSKPADAQWQLDDGLGGPKVPAEFLARHTWPSSNCEQGALVRVVPSAIHTWSIALTALHRAGISARHCQVVRCGDQSAGIYAACDEDVAQAQHG